MERQTEQRLTEMGLSQDAIRILKHSYDGILVTESDSTIVFVNNAYSRILGVSSERLLNRRLSEVEPNSVTLKVMENREEVVNISEHVASLDEWIFCSVLLIPSPDDFSGSVSIITKLDEKLRTDQEEDSSQRNVEFYMDEVLSRETPVSPAFSKIVGNSSKLKQSVYRANKASKADFPVLVVGESGTGKELIVRAIHEASARRNYQFVALNCAALPSTLVESELFGYEGGSFTNARKEGKKGLFELGHLGTLFFDEIGDFEMSTQAKILRVLEEGTFRRVGGENNFNVDTRVISATNKDLESMIVEGKFREDLFYRLNTMRIHVPALRERGSDLELLTDHFLREYSEQYGKSVDFSADAMATLYDYEWPGNVRELRGAINYAVNMADGEFITRADLPPYLTLSKTKAALGKQLPLRGGENSSKSEGHQSAYRDIMDSFERDLLDVSLRKCKNRTEAMELLGLSRRSFYLKLKKHGFI